MAHFLPSWYNFYCVMARSRYKFDASDIFITGNKFYALYWRSVAVKTVSEPEFVMVQELDCLQMRVSGCNGHYEFVSGAGAKAKSVTNNLPILSVL